MFDFYFMIPLAYIWIMSYAAGITDPMKSSVYKMNVEEAGMYVTAF